MFAHVFKIMPLQRDVRGCPTRKKVEEQRVLNAPEVKPQGEVSNVESCEDIKMLS